MVQKLFDYISPQQLRSPKKSSSNKYIVRRKRKPSSAMKKKSPPKTAKKSPPKTAKKTASKTAKKTAPKTAKKTAHKSVSRATSRSTGRSYKKRTGAKKHGSMRSYLKGKDMNSRLSPVVESPDKQISPESKRLRRLGFYGNLPRTPKMSKSDRKMLGLK